MQEIIEKIKQTLKPEIDTWETETFIYIKKLEKYCKETVYSEAKGAQDIFKLKTKAGWNKSMERYFGLSQDNLKSLIAKEAQAKLTKIDIAVKKLLANEEVKTVESLSFTMRSKNSFCEGSWKINGNKILSFRAIYAGGYNIQTLHIRTLFSYK